MSVRIPYPDLDFLPIPDPGVKNGPDPGSRTLEVGDTAHRSVADFALKRKNYYTQGFGSGLDPYSIGPVDPDPYSKSGSRSRRAKMTHKSREFF
jgi:hypothetical protein